MENIIIIDDTKTNALLIECILGKEYNVESIFDSVDALSIIKEKQPDIILLDIVMSNISGFDLLKAIKNEKKLTNTSVFVVSGLNHSSAKTKAFELGADNYIEKPINAKRLLKLVKTHSKILH